MDYYVQMTNPFNAAERSLISVINYDTASFPFLSGVSQGLLGDFGLRLPTQVWWGFSQ